MTLPGYVLAGGRSQRMGRDKALLPVDGVPMALRVARALAAAGCAPVTLVGRQSTLEALGLPVLSAEEDAAHRHPLWGVAAALQASAGAPLVCLAPCDLADLTAEALAPLLARGGPCVAAGQPLLCVLAPSPPLAEAARRLAAQQAPVRALTRDLPAITVPEAALRNVNRPADLIRNRAEPNGRRTVQ